MRHPSRRWVALQWMNVHWLESFTENSSQDCLSITTWLSFPWGRSRNKLKPNFMLHYKTFFSFSVSFLFSSVCISSLLFFPCVVAAVNLFSLARSLLSLLCFHSAAAAAHCISAASSSSSSSSSSVGDQAAWSMMPAASCSSVSDQAGASLPWSMSKKGSRWSTKECHICR